jgi:hypothetical protein
LCSRTGTDRRVNFYQLHVEDINRLVDARIMYFKVSETNYSVGSSAILSQRRDNLGNDVSATVFCSMHDGP